jgi:hypothetical protein
MEASPSTLHNELKYAGHCWANQDSWLVAHASTTESNCGGNSLSLYLYIYMGILGFPQNRDKTRFHGQFVVPACSHKLLAITAITGSTSTNSTGTETGKPRAITCVPAFEITLVTSLTFSTFENLTQRFQRPKSRKNQGFSSSTSSTF